MVGETRNKINKFLTNIIFVKRNFQHTREPENICILLEKFRYILHPYRDFNIVLKSRYCLSIIIFPPHQHYQSYYQAIVSPPSLHINNTSQWKQGLVLRDYRKLREPSPSHLTSL